MIEDQVEDVEEVEVADGDFCFKRQDSSGWPADVVLCGWIDDTRDNPPRNSVDEEAVGDALAIVLAAVSTIYGAAAERRIRSKMSKIPVTYSGQIGNAIGRCDGKFDRPVNRIEMMMGSASAKANPTRIRITKKLKFSDAQLHETLVHEYAHAARMLLTKNYLAEPDHSDEWKAIMVEAGESPYAISRDADLNRQGQENYDRRRQQRRDRAEAARDELREGLDKLKKKQVVVGLPVFFTGKRRYSRKLELISGVVSKLNAKTAGIQEKDGGTWRVDYSQLYTDGSPPRTASSPPRRRQTQRRRADSGSGHSHPARRSQRGQSTRGRAAARRAPDRSKKVWLFSYGSNTPTQLAERLGHKPSKVKAAFMDDTKRIFRGHSRNWGGGVASLKRSSGNQVYGYVARVTEKDLDTLDRFEGVRSGNYKRKNVKVWDEEEKGFSAIAYVSTSSEFGEPTEEYLEAIADLVNEFWDDDDGPIGWYDIDIA